jgi:2-polyprenyl-3-methyl-5-hydroxy-6-metoxy-1,4-benzoquinol methylase
MGEYVENQREFFDKLITEQWSTYFNERWDCTRRFEVRSILRVAPGPARVLDLGCGCGFHDAVFAECGAVEEIIGVDYSPKSVEQANRQYPHPKIKRFEMDITQPAEIVRRFGLFDLVVSFQVLEHLVRPEEIIDASVACAKDGGFVAVVTPNRETAQNRFRRLAGKPTRMMDPLHYREFVREELEDMLTRRNLQVVATFAHSLGVTIAGKTVIKNNSALGFRLGRWMPAVADMIGLVARKSGRPAGGSSTP